MAQTIADGHVLSCHDVSDGGWLVAAAEMSIASGLGLKLDAIGEYFDERTGSYLVEVRAQGV